MITIISILSVFLLFRYTYLPYVLILQIWRTRAITKGIIQPFLHKVVYITSDRPLDKIHNHEMKHLEQVERMGAYTFCFTYILNLLRYGYRDNPLEIEARRAEYEN